MTLMYEINATAVVAEQQERLARLRPGRRRRDGRATRRVLRRRHDA